MTTAIAPAPEQWYDKTWLVIVLCIFVFPVGLYALWKSEQFSKTWKIAGTVLVAFLVVGAIAINDPSKENPSTATATPAASEPTTASEKKEDKAEKATLFIAETPDHFKNAFNAYTSSNNLDFTIDELEVKEGEVQNTFQYMFTDHLGLIGTINKSDGSVKGVTMIGSGDGTAKSGGNIMLCMLSIIATVDPSIKPENRVDVLKALGLLGDKDVDIMNMSTKTDRNGIHYFISSSRAMGMMFGASKE